ncbi:L-threonylcarbamoyladenylate synthase [Aerococcaceae bacterium WGS1372]
MEEQYEKAFNTRIFNRESLKDAAEALQKGQLVAFPTETVFGLGAIANNEAAVRSVFETKGRPQDNPLIVHVHNPKQVDTYVKEVNVIAKQLMDAFWPGPLTIIFPVKEDIFAPSVTPGQSTVGIRMPNQLESLLLIEMTGFPIVGPSANISGKPSPTSVDHVMHDFDGKIAGVVNNYSAFTDVGVESTVVRPTEDSVEILRPGVITKKMIEKIVKVKVIEKTAIEQLKDPSIASPGVKYTHYSPNQPVYMINPKHSIRDWMDFITNTDKKIGVLAQDSIIDELKEQNLAHSYYSLGESNNIESPTQRLFAGLRELESSGCEAIFVQSFEENEHTHAYLNRLSKASKTMI